MGRETVEPGAARDHAITVQENDVALRHDAQGAFDGFDVTTVDGVPAQERVGLGGGGLEHGSDLWPGGGVVEQEQAPRARPAGGPKRVEAGGEASRVVVDRHDDGDPVEGRERREKLARGCLGAMGQGCRRLVWRGRRQASAVGRCAISGGASRRRRAQRRQQWFVGCWRRSLLPSPRGRRRVARHVRRGGREIGHIRARLRPALGLALSEGGSGRFGAAWIARLDRGGSLRAGRARRSGERGERGPLARL